MARPNIESSAAPAVQGGLENHIQLGAALLICGSAVAAAVYPGVLIGAGVAALWRWWHRPALWLRIAAPLLAFVAFFALRSGLQTAWLWRNLFSGSLLGVSIAPVDASDILRSVAVEAFAGPAIFESFLIGLVLSRRSVGGQIRRDHRREKAQWRALSGQRGTASKLRTMLPDPHNERGDGSTGHPPGFVRLAIDGESHQPLDLKLPDELALHVFLPGLSGSGKTTTIERLGDGVLANGYGLAIVDCKGGGLGDTAYALAGRYGLPFYVVDPDDGDTLGYDVCSGDGPNVANKLIGAFSYGPNAEIYKNIAMEALPLVVSGLLAAGEQVTLDRLYEAFGPRGLAIIAQKITPTTAEQERVKKRLLALSAADDKVGAGGRSGLQRRLGALLEGKFGPLFRLPQTLDWERAFESPSVVYVALPVMASSEDVDLMGGVIIQDLKQVFARRIRMRRDGEHLFPILTVLEEFAGLSEPEQVRDQLVQAREALAPTVVATQYIPESVPLRKALLGAGLIISHRVEGGDAEDIANQFGTRRTTEITHQMDYATGYSEKGSVRRVPAYNVSPDILRTLDPGDAVIRSVFRKRHAIAHVIDD